MKFHEVCRVTSTLLFISGLYLPAIHKLVHNKYQIVASRVFGKLLAIASPFYTTFLFLPIFNPVLTVLDKTICFLSGLICYPICLKMYLFNYNIPKLERLIKIWNEINEEDFYSQLREELLIKRKRTTDVWSIVFGLLLVSVVGSTNTIPFFTRQLHHKTILPYTTDYPLFDILCIFELTVISSLCIIVNAYNCFLMQIVAFEGVLCNYLKLSLDDIMRGLCVSDEGSISYDIRYYTQREGVDITKLMSYGEICSEVEKKLRFWIKLHQMLIRYHDVMREVYQISLAIDYIGLILTTGLTVFLYVSDSLNSETIFNLFAYAMATYTIFYVSCYYGDSTEFLSGNLARDAFDSGWYVYPKHIRYAYLFIMTRCRKPLYLKAVDIYPLNSRSFGTIFGFGYKL